MAHRNYTTEDIDLIRSRCSMTYAEAAALLDEVDGDTVEAMVKLESEGRMNRGTVKQVIDIEHEDGGDEIESIRSFLLKWWRIGCGVKLVIERREKTVASLPALYVILALLLGFRLCLISAVIVLLAGCRVHIRLLKGVSLPVLRFDGRKKEEPKTEEQPKSEPVQASPETHEAEVKTDDNGFFRRVIK